MQVILGLSIPILSHELAISEFESLVLIKVSVRKIKRFLKPSRVGWFIARAEIDKFNEVLILFSLDFESFHLDEGLNCIIEFIIVKNERNGFGKVDFRLPSERIMETVTLWACQARANTVFSWFLRPVGRSARRWSGWFRYRPHRENRFRFSERSLRCCLTRSKSLIFQVNPYWESELRKMSREKGL